MSRNIPDQLYYGIFCWRYSSKAFVRSKVFLLDKLLLYLLNKAKS
jgi:hypothetical protein